MFHSDWFSFPEYPTVHWPEWRDKENVNQLPMPTCPPFSSDGVPGPLAGRESAPSVALNIFTIFKEREREREKAKKKEKKEKERKRKIWFRLIFSENYFYFDTIYHYTRAHISPKGFLVEVYKTKKKQYYGYKLVRKYMKKHTDGKVSWHFRSINYS